MSKRLHPVPPAGIEERAYLVGVTLPDGSMAKEREYLDELERLATTAGAVVVGKSVQGRTRIDGATFIGAGKAEEIREECRQLEANLLIFDSDLSPAQARNLEKIVEINVIDRTELILDIFARHAKTRQAKIQVELAQLSYALPRLRRLWDHLSRQVGGIGTRGPGETQLEVDRRRIYSRMSRLRRQLEKIRKRKEVINRSRGPLPVAALVGYTNAGKSTLLNALTGADVLVRDQLFATLDTTTRKLAHRDHQPVLLVDTVGFIRKLPHHLVDTFRATLEEIAQASLYLHVVDLSHPGFMEQMEVVEATLSAVDNPEVESIYVFNKIDRVDPVKLRAMVDRFPRAAFVSAREGDGVEKLKSRLAAFFAGRPLKVEVKLPAGEGRAIAIAKSLLLDPSDKVDGSRLVLVGRVVARNRARLENIPRAEVRYLGG